jgi:hypothetical protein
VRKATARPSQIRRELAILILDPSRHSATRNTAPIILEWLTDGRYSTPDRNEGEGMEGGRFFRTPRERMVRARDRDGEASGRSPPRNESLLPSLCRISCMGCNNPKLYLTLQLQPVRARLLLLPTAHRLQAAARRTECQIVDESGPVPNSNLMPSGNHAAFITSLVPPDL